MNFISICCVLRGNSANAKLRKVVMTWMNGDNCFLGQVVEKIVYAISYGNVGQSLGSGNMEERIQ